MTSPKKLKELEDITIDFNEYLQTVTENLKHLEIGVQAIVTNIRTEIDELSKGTICGKILYKATLLLLNYSKLLTLYELFSLQLFQVPRYQWNR